MPTLLSDFKNPPPVEKNNCPWPKEWLVVHSFLHAREGQKLTTKTTPLGVPCWRRYGPNKGGFRGGRSNRWGKENCFSINYILNRLPFIWGRSYNALEGVLGCYNYFPQRLLLPPLNPSQGSPQTPPNGSDMVGFERHARRTIP